MSKVDIRRQDLVDWLMMEETLSVGDVASRYHISMPTARKMCALLADEGIAVRTHGGLRRLAQGSALYSFDRLTHENREEKARIGKYAASLIESGKTVFFEAGTTVLQCVLAFAERIKSNQLTNMVVFTNSLINLEILHQVCPVNLIGGLYRVERKDFSGYMSELALENLIFDYCVMGADAVSLSGGVMAMDIETVRFDKALAARSQNVLLLAHSDKFNLSSLLSFAPVTAMSVIITDAGIGEDVYQQYLSQQINLLRA
jgi:DeoR/GlpR family transcriptional regulator of sugar metabolism